MMKDYKVKSIKKELCKEWLLKKHYAKRIPSIKYAFGLFKDNILVGVCCYGIPPQLNCMLLCGDDFKNNVLELNRLVKNDNLLKNTQSFFLGQTFKLLPKPTIIISYADPNNGHNGYTYQATNFYFTGKGGMNKEYFIDNKQLSARHINKNWIEKNKGHWDNTKTIDENFVNFGGKVLPQKPKNRYVLFLGSKKQKKILKKKLTWKILPYPKGKNKNYDASFNPTIQTELF